MDLTGVALALALTLGPRPGPITFLTPDEGFPSSYPRALALAGDALWVGLGATGSPEGLARITAPGTPAQAIQVFRHVGDAPADAPPDLVHDLEGVGDDVFVATGRGLHRWRAADARFEPLYALAAVTAITRAPDGAVWVVVGRDEHAATAAPLAALDTLPARPACRRPLLLAARSASLATLVCEDRLLDLGAKAGLEVDLTGTPLRLEPSGGERDRPPVWIHAAAQGDDGALYLLSQRGGLVRRLDDVFVKVLDDSRERRLREERARQLVLPNTDLMELLAEPGGGALVGDVRGVVQRWTGAAAEQVWPLRWTMGLQSDPADGGVRLVAASSGARAALWLVRERPDSHVLFRVDRRPLGPVATFWSLRRTGRSYLDPGVLAALPDGEGGLWVSTNDGLWHLGR